MINWIDVNERLPEKSGGYLVWYGKEDTDIEYAVAQACYSSVHMLWNCRDTDRTAKTAITGVKYWAEINTPYDHKTEDEQHE